MSFKYFDSLTGFARDPLAEHSTFLFDCDGLLLDTEPLYTRAACTLIHRLGGELLPALPPTLKLSVMGRTRLSVAEKMTAWLQAEHGIHCSPADWSSQVEAFEHEEFRRGCQLLPGARELVQWLRGQGKIALATSSQRSAFEIKTRPHRQVLFDHFPVIVCGDDLEGKIWVVSG